MIWNNRSLCSPNYEGQKSEMSITGLQPGCQLGLRFRGKSPVHFWWLWLSPYLWSRRCSLCLVATLLPPLYLPSPLCQTSFSLPLIRIYAVAFRVHADDPGWSPHVKVLNHICKEPLWSCEAKGHIRWHSQVPGIRMGVSFWGAGFSTL